jgi:hypothetical protein
MQKKAQANPKQKAKVHSAGIQKRMLNLRKGQGVGKKAGLGQIHHQRFAKPFKKALRSIMANHHLPKRKGVSESYTSRILIDFKDNMQRRFASVYDEDEWSNKMSRPSLMDNCRTIALGTFTGSKLPYYVHDAILDIEDERWKSFWMKALIVKHNHFVYKKAHDKNGEPQGFSLLAMDGSVPEDENPKPYDPEYFNTITIPALSPADADDDSSSSSSGASDHPSPAPPPRQKPPPPQKQKPPPPPQKPPPAPVAGKNLNGRVTKPRNQPDFVPTPVARRRR